MNRKLIIISFALSFFYSMVAAQKQPLINNSTFQFGVLRTSLKRVDSGKVELPKYLVQAKLPDAIRDQLLKFTYKDWLQLLSDKNTDWAANLFLYDIYKRDAGVEYSFIMTRDEWIKYLKKKDIAYWKAKLKN